MKNQIIELFIESVNNLNFNFEQGVLFLIACLGIMVGLEIKNKIGSRTIASIEVFKKINDLN